MKLTGIIILGVNGNCIDIAEAVETLAQRGEPLKVAGFLDDTATAKEVAGYPVLGRIADAPKFSEAMFVNGIGSPKSYKLKPDIIAKSQVPPGRWATVIHPAASISPRATIGHGTVLLANSTVGTGVTLGNHVMVLQNSVLSHDSVVGDYTAIATGVCLSGNVQIGTNCYLGSNCCVREGTHIGDRALAGLGAVVTKDVAADAVVIGNPARPYLRSR